MIRSLGIRIVYTVHNPLPHGDRRRTTKWKYRQLYRLADALVVLGKQMGRDVTELVYQGAKNKLYVIEHGLLMPKTPCPSKTEARGQLGLKIEDEVELYFGRIAAYKGINDLIDAIYLVTKKRTKLRLLIAGIPHEPFSPYEMRIKNIGLVNKIHFWPEFVTEDFKVTLYAAADIIVLPHRDPSQSAMGLEALALGKPMIVTNVGALPDLVDHEKTGYIVPVQDPSAIAEAILNFFILSKEEQQVMAELSRQLGLKCFDWKAISAKHIALYRSLVRF